MLMSPLQYYTPSTLGNARADRLLAYSSNSCTSRPILSLNSVTAASTCGRQAFPPAHSELHPACSLPACMQLCTTCELHSFMPCHAMPCHAMLMLCHAMPCYAHAMPCHAMLMLCYAMPCHAMPCYAHAMLCHAMPCYAHAMPCHAMPCHQHAHPVPYCY